MTPIPEADAKYRFLLLITLLATFSLITLGAVVRVTESGLGCPDWPLCHGRLIPPAETHVLIEYSHRLVASVVGLLVMAAMVWTWWKYRSVRRIMVPVGLASVLVVVQVILGGLTVLTELSGNVVMVHLLTGELIFACLLVGYVWSFGRRNRVTDESGSWSRLTLGSAVFTLVLIGSGSYVVGTGAGAVCPNWPLCSGDWIPDYQLMWVHMLHRLMAVIVGAYILFIGSMIVMKYRRDKLLLLLSISSAALVVVQVFIGAGNIWFDFSPVLRVLHLSLATMLFGVTIIMAIKIGQVQKAGDLIG